MEQEKKRGSHLPDSPHMNAVRVLIRVMRRHHACVERRIGALNIHHGQHRMLMQLARHEGDVPSQKELAETMGISPAAVTVTLKKLEREGYISRSMTDEDNRRNEIRITEKGISKVTESRAMFEATDKELFADFSPEELETFVSFLERMNRNLDAVGAPVEPPAPHPAPSRKEV